MVTGTMKEESDIDFYLVTAPNRLYLTRALIIVTVHLTGWRRYGSKIRGRICLNRFATTKALDITPHNEYHARVFSGLMPLYAEHSVYRKYVQANQWMSQLDYQIKEHQVTKLKFNFGLGVKQFGQWILKGRTGDWLEQRFAKWQQQRILKDPRTKEQGSRVFIRANELCLHPIKK